MISSLSKNTAVAAALALALSATAAEAGRGIRTDRIFFGQSTALEGPASALGQGLNAGILAAFAEANRGGGVKSRRLELISYDDAYEADQAIVNTNRLIERDQVIALIGGAGTPTSQAAQPIATEAQVPFIGPFTGAGFLRNAELTNVVNLRATYGQETEAWVQHLTDDLGYDRIAILYQDDSFGRAGLAAVQKALEKRGLSLVSQGSFRRNTTAVKPALLSIRRGKPQAVVTVGPYKPIAEFIKLAGRIDLKATFVNISYVGSKALAKELGAAGAGVVVTQVVPFPWDTSMPLVRRYQKALKAIDPTAEPGFVSLEGYMAGRLAILALESIRGEPTRQALIDAFASIRTFDLGGITLTYGPGDNQGMDQVFLSVIQSDGSFKAVDRLGGENRSRPY